MNAKLAVVVGGCLVLPVQGRSDGAVGYYRVLSESIDANRTTLALKRDLNGSVTAHEVLDPLDLQVFGFNAWVMIGLGTSVFAVVLGMVLVVFFYWAHRSACCRPHQAVRQQAMRQQALRQAATLPNSMPAHQAAVGEPGKTVWDERNAIGDSSCGAVSKHASGAVSAFLYCSDVVSSTGTSSSRLAFADDSSPTVDEKLTREHHDAISARRNAADGGAATGMASSAVLGTRTVSGSTSGIADRLSPSRLPPPRLMVKKKKEKSVRWPVNDPIVEAAPVLNGQRAALRRLTDDEKHELGLIFELDLPPNPCVGELDDEDDYIPVAERPSLMSSSTFASRYSSGSTALPPPSAMPPPLPPPILAETPSLAQLARDSVVELERLDAHSRDSDCVPLHQSHSGWCAGFRTHTVGRHSSNRRSSFDSQHQQHTQQQQHEQQRQLSIMQGRTITTEWQGVHTPFTLHEETLQVL